ncbi:cysteine-rich receptor-like protein kinase 26, partial [Tanacetum coccineum]
MFMLVRNVSLLWLSFVFSYLITTLAQPKYFSHFCGTNVTRNSAFKKNLDTSLSNLTGTNNGFGFFNLSVGQGIDKVNSAVVCRGDINPDVCQSCLSDSMVTGRKVCPNSSYAILWYDDCWLTYSNDEILGNIDTSDFSYSGSQTTNVGKFNDDLRSLLEKLKADAASGGALRKFASGNAPGPDSITIYAIMQCSPDISEQDCISCLDNIIVKHISGKMKGSVRGRALDTMCNFQYSERRFFNESIALVNPPPPSSSPSSSRSSSLPSPPPSSSLPSPL